MTEKRARVVIADLSSADEACCTNISQALQFFFSLHNSLPGTPKIQLFALFVVGKCVQCLVPLQNVKLNWLAVSKRISTLQSTGDAHFGPTTFEVQVSQVLADCFKQFQIVTKKTDGNSNTLPVNLDICLFTNNLQIEKQVARVIKEHDISLIKKVQIVHIASMNGGELDMQTSQSSTESQDSELTEILCGYTESIYLQNSCVSIEQFFKSWLVEGGTEDIQLFISFNSNVATGFILKCDLQDALINPINIPKGKALTMETTLNPTIPVHAASRNKPVKPETYTLRPVKFLRICNLCESVVYGVPVVVRATVCWKLPWDELERNQTQFMGVKTHLQKQDLCLLLNETRDGLTSYFVLLPSPGPTMLIKSIATREIIMPHDTPVTSTDGVVPGDVLVQLDKIEVAASFNPVDFTSGLFSHTNNPTQQQTNSKKPLGYKTSKSTSSFANSNRHDVSSTATNSSTVKPAFRYNSGSDFQRKTGGDNTHRKAVNLPAKQDIDFSDKYVPKFGNSAATNQWLVNNKQSESSQGVGEPPAKKKPVFSKFPNKL